MDNQLSDDLSHDISDDISDYFDDILITDALIVTCDGNHSIIENGVMAVNNGKITALEKSDTLAAKKLAERGEFYAIVCLGAVIRGETSHYDYVCTNASSGIASVSLETGVPISFGLLTTESLEQAIERSGSKAGNQGRYATECAIEMARLLKHLSEA